MSDDLEIAIAERDALCRISTAFSEKAGPP
jgi:hypothetical protein